MVSSIVEMYTRFFSSDLMRQCILVLLFFFLMIRRPPRSTLDRSSAASDVYKRQVSGQSGRDPDGVEGRHELPRRHAGRRRRAGVVRAVSYTHLRAHETVLDLVCRLLLEKKNTIIYIDTNI